MTGPRPVAKPTWKSCSRHFAHRCPPPHSHSRPFPPSEALPAGVQVTGTFLEDEGLTIVAPAEQLAGTTLEHSGPFAKISLAVHSSLAAVGLTAAISAALAKERMSVNLSAGYFHDHVFIPWDDRHRALTILRNLSPGLL